jgi:hypothetical protein
MAVRREGAPISDIPQGHRLLTRPSFPGLQIQNFVSAVTRTQAEPLRRSDSSAAWQKVLETRAVDQMPPWAYLTGWVRSKRLLPSTRKPSSFLIIYCRSFRAKVSTPQGTHLLQDHPPFGPPHWRMVSIKITNFLDRFYSFRYHNHPRIPHPEIRFHHDPSTPQCIPHPLQFPQHPQSRNLPLRYRATARHSRQSRQYQTQCPWQLLYPSRMGQPSPHPQRRRRTPFHKVHCQSSDLASDTVVQLSRRREKGS